MHGAYKTNRSANADVDVYCRENGDTIELDVTFGGTGDTRSTRKMTVEASWPQSDIVDRTFQILSRINDLNKITDITAVKEIEDSILREVGPLSYHIIGSLNRSRQSVASTLRAALANAEKNGTVPVLRIRGGGLHFLPWELMTLEAEEPEARPAKSSLLGANFIIHYAKADEVDPEAAGEAKDDAIGATFPPIIGHQATPPKVFFAMYTGTGTRRLDWALSERRYFEVELKSRIRCEVLRPLKEAGGKQKDLEYFKSKWTKESFEVRHLSCHGRQVGNWKPHLSHFNVTVDSDFDVGEKDLLIRFAPGHWLAFLNHCHAANFIRVTGANKKSAPLIKNASAAAMATHLVRHSSAAVVASACELDDEFAAEISKVFYSRFLPAPMGLGEDLGTAAYESRRHFLGHRCALVAMTYRIFGRPDMRFAPGRRKSIAERIGNWVGAGR